MSHTVTKHWVSFLVLLLAVALVVFEAPAQSEKLMPDQAVMFRVGAIDNVFIQGTTTDADRQEAVLPCSFAVYGEFAPPTVNTIQLKVQYDPSALLFLGASLDDFGAIAPQDVYWHGQSDVDDSTPGLLIIVLDQDVQATSAAYQDFIYLKFTPLCQPELTLNMVEILFDYTESFIIDTTRYADPGDPDRNGSVTVADYEGFLALNDYDPYDAEPPTMTLQGVIGAGAEIVVPIILASNATVDHLMFAVQYDGTKLQPTEYSVGGPCHTWDWMFDVPTPTETFVPMLIFNTPHGETDTGTPCEIASITFTVVGDWRGGSTDLVILEPDLPVFYFGEPGNYCSAVDAGFGIFGMSAVVPQYEASLQMVVDDMIYPADEPTKTFVATIEATNNFNIGGEWGVGDDATAPLRINLDLGPDMVLADVYQPTPGAPNPANPLDDFYFDANQGGTKSLDWDVELYSVPKAELPNRRAPTDEFTSLLRMELIQQITAPAAFDDYRLDLDYLCALNGLSTRLHDANTDSIEVACADGLLFTDAPHIDFASGELTCVTRTSTKPASVVQEYWVRSSFDLADFRVRVNKSGAHHIVDVDPADGVYVADSGADYVVFADDDDWIDATFTAPHLIGTITYNAYTSTPVITVAKAGDDAEKDVGPPIRWCWTWTTISFDPSSYLHAANGLEPYMFASTGNVGTRWDCSIVVNPDPLPQLKSDGDLPTAFALTGNVPNPFNPSTMIRFDVPRTARVTVGVLDLQGRRVATLVDGVEPAGRHEVRWNGTDETGRRVASGVYFAVMTAEDFTQKSKMVLLK